MMEGLFQNIPGWGWPFIVIAIVVGVLLFFAKKGERQHSTNISIGGVMGLLGLGNKVSIVNNQAVVKDIEKNSDDINMLSIESLVNQLNKDISSYDIIARYVALATIEERGTKTFQEELNRKEEFEKRIIGNARFLCSRTRIEITINSVSDVKRFVDAVNNQQKGWL